MEEYYLGDRDLAKSRALKEAAKRAYKMAGIKKPEKEIDLVELSNYFSFQELLYPESLGLCKPGQGAKLLDSGKTMPDGENAHKSFGRGAGRKPDLRCRPDPRDRGRKPNCGRSRQTSGEEITCKHRAGPGVIWPGRTKPVRNYLERGRQKINSKMRGISVTGGKSSLQDFRNYFPSLDGRGSSRRRAKALWRRRGEGEATPSPHPRGRELKVRYRRKKNKWQEKRQ